MLAAKKLGDDRAAQGSFLMKSLLSNGTVLALGSDWTVNLTRLHANVAVLSRNEHLAYFNYHNKFNI